MQYKIIKVFDINVKDKERELIMTYKLMAVDIDGTLLNNSSELTENTKSDKGLKKALYLQSHQEDLYRVLKV